MDTQSLFAQRIGGPSFGTSQRIFKFTLIDNMKREFERKNPGVAVIDMGVGEPEERAADPVIHELYTQAQRKENRIYPCNGGPEFKEAAARYLERLLGTRFDPNTEIMHCMGSKNALAQIPLAFIDNADTVIGTTPGYPTFMTVSEWLGAKVVKLKLLAKNRFLPDLSELEQILSEGSKGQGKTEGKVKALLLNYPNNPTGAIATKEFYQRVIELAHKYTFLIVQDAAYADYSYAGSYISPLQFDGGKEVTLELYSLSKGYNMQGFRLGFVVGGSKLIKAYANVKDNTDNGQFLAIQKTGAFALDNLQTELANNQGKYQRRMERVCKILERFGLEAKPSPGTFYIYFPVPERFLGKSFEIGTPDAAQTFSSFLIDQLGIVSVPWDEAGPHIRLSMTFEVATKAFLREEAVYWALEKRLSEGKIT